METFKRDLFESGGFQILEDAKDVDGVHILAKVRGTFFVPDGESRNKRFYPRAVWEKVVADKDIRKKLGERRMIGTISHKQAIDDTALLEGKISHIVTNLGLEGNDGIGEALIINTPAGRILNTFVRAKAKIFVSSRAEGGYKGEVNGVPAVNPDNYALETFDFILDPGFVEANPKLVEKLNEDYNYVFGKQTINEDSGGQEDMDAKILEALTTEKLKLNEELKNALDALEQEKARTVTLTSENTYLKDQTKDLDKVKADLKLYEECGKVEDLKATLKSQKESLDKYTVIGSPELIKEALTKSIKILKEYKEIGTPSKIKIGIENSLALLTKYSTLGAPKKVQEALNKARKIIAKMKESDVVEKAKALAKALNKPFESIKKLLDKGHSEKEIREIVSEITESTSIRDRFKKKDKGKETPEGDNKITGKSRGERIMEDFSKTSAVPSKQ